MSDFSSSDREAHVKMTTLDSVKSHLRSKLIETIGYREPSPEERQVFSDISSAETISEAEKVFADYLRTLE